MITLQKGHYFKNNGLQEEGAGTLPGFTPEENRKKTMAGKILLDHNHSGDEKSLKIKFDAAASHDITYVGIIQTARASGLTQFPIPYVLTNCHNSLCAVGGTINEDDHRFGLSAVKKYGGIFVPAHQAVIHQYMREEYAGCGKMILGSDSHTRYGAIGTLGIGEGGPEIVKQLLSRTYDIAFPDIVAVYLEGTPRPGLGPQDVALAIIGEVFKSGFVKNSILEFIGPGIAGLSMDFRMGIDVMTTETTCISSIWTTDDKTEQFLAVHGRSSDFSRLAPEEGAYYDRVVRVDLSAMESMIALPFHPSNTMTIREANRNAGDVLEQIKKEAASITEDTEVSFGLSRSLSSKGLRGDQGIVAGCAGGMYENIIAVRDILNGNAAGGDDFNLSVYPSSQPVYAKLAEDGVINDLMNTGAVIRSAFCGPCFGAGDTPANDSLSFRHTTRNFPNREGSKPGDGQLSAVALMDARSIAATAANGGELTAATNVKISYTSPSYTFNSSIYSNSIHSGFGKGDVSVDLVFGPNIKDWPEMISLPDNLVLSVASWIDDPVTTTDELIPSGETSSYRSNPLRLAEFTLSRRDPGYVGRAKEIYKLEMERRDGGDLAQLISRMGPGQPDTTDAVLPGTTGLGSLVAARKPGDGSAREQAASCQRVLGGCANIAVEYATKRYRSNLINWGMIPFEVNESDFAKIAVSDSVVIRNIRELIAGDGDSLPGTVLKNGKTEEITLKVPNLTKDERAIILEGCLINYYKAN